MSEENKNGSPADKTPLVELSNASIYQQGTLILGEVNIRIEKGEFVYLIGKTGSGKSSLLRTLYGDLPLETGEGKVVGFDLQNLTWKQVPYLRRKLGIIFQDFQLLTDRTVEANLAFALRATGWKDKKAIIFKIEEVLTTVGLSTKGFKMPHELSGGEQQKVVIARALLNDPELILADEPTGNLDTGTSDEIINVLKKVSQEEHRSVLIATHDVMILEKFASRMIKCQNGKIVGTKEVLV